MIINGSSVLYNPQLFPDKKLNNEIGINTSNKNERIFKIHGKKLDMVLHDNFYVHYLKMEN